MLPPLSTIGILGGGQLGRMMALAAAQLGYKTHIFTPEQDSPASQVAAFTTVADYTDSAALERFARSVQVVTLEFENVPTDAVRRITAITPVHPGADVLHITQHRVREKSFINGLGIGTAPFRPVGSGQELIQAANELGYPCILKTCEMGYDGKGQWMLKGVDGGRWTVDGEKNLPSLSLPPTTNHQPPTTSFILEGFVDFTMEISVIVARGLNGQATTYCPVQNIHQHHILAETIAPAPITPELASKAESIALRIAEGINLVGLLAVEMFVTRGGDILVNELAPRPHNSGHWTMEACVTSQFEQAIRAACGLPLGSAERLCDARMINLIGGDADAWQKHLADNRAKLHLYGKAESRPGRKMGHVTILEEP